MKIQHYYLLAIFAFCPYSSFSQCQSELCKHLEKAQKDYITIKGENERLKKELASLRKEVRTLRSENQRLRKENEQLRLELAKLKKDQAAYSAAQVRLAELEEEQRKKQETITSQDKRIAQMRSDSIDSVNRYGQFEARNIILDDGYVIPYKLNLGPITFSRQDGYPLEPSYDQLSFLDHLSKIHATQKVIVLVHINAPAKRRNQIINDIREQIEQYCPNCEVQTEYETGSKWEINLNFQSKRA